MRLCVVCSRACVRRRDSVCALGYVCVRDTVRACACVVCLYLCSCSAIIECADAAHGLGGHIISDGGCKVPGDLSKAFGGGADFVMMGGEGPHTHSICSRTLHLFPIPWLCCGLC